MEFNRKMLIAVMVIMLATPGLAGVANAQEKQSRSAQSSGAGILKVGDETFKLSSVIVKLIDDRQAELILVSDITIFLSGTWSNHGESQEFDIDITGGASRGGIQAAGKLLLSKDGKSVLRLTIKGANTTTKRRVEANFEGK